MTPTKVDGIAGLSLTPPRLLYEAGDPSWGLASLARPHLAHTLDGATLTVPAEGDRIATFEAKPLPAVQPYLESPTVAWRGLLVEQRLLSRPELIWTGAFPNGWDEGLKAPWAEALADALGALHRSYLSLVEERSSSYALRSVECAECRAERLAKLPPNLPSWHFHMRSASRCAHLAAAQRAMGALSRAHPELTFELLGWIEPAGARAEAEGPPVTRFGLTRLLMEALLGTWLVGEAQRPPPRTSFRGYAWSRGFSRWGQAVDPRRPMLPREQHNGVALAASAWGFTGEPEALVEGDAGAEPPGLERSAAPPIETPAALPGGRVRGKAARQRSR